MPNLFDSFRQNAAELGVDSILSSADVIAVGFSGGADSTALLHLLCGCYATAEIHAFHVNHGIREGSADRDEEHCRAVCEGLGVTFVSKNFDVPTIAQEMRIGLEEAARKVRYSAFDEYLSSLDSAGKHAVVAMAHNADDNLETMIFNLIRGSGTRGLCGIVPVRGRVVRPLLCYTSDEIRNFCVENGFDYVTDETNSDTKYTRNLIRSEVLPHLREITPNCAQAALSASMLVRRDDEYLNRIAIGALESENATSANADMLRDFDDCVMSRTLLRMYSNARGGRKNFGSVHLDSCIRLIRTAESGEISLPGRMVMKLDSRKVFFSPQEKKCDDPVFSRIILESGNRIDGKVRYFHFPEVGFCIAVSDVSLPIPEKPDKGENIYKISIHTTISFGKINGSIFVRNRLPGDKIVMGGMTRKVKKLLNAAHMEMRGCIPFFCDEDGIFYIPGIGLRDGVAQGAGDIRLSYWR